MLERAFHDGLFPRLMFRSEATPQIWPGNVGDTMVFSGVGLIRPKMRPLTPGQDPAPSDYTKEQWTAQLQQYADSIDTHMPTSTVAIADLFLRNAQQLGLSAGQSLNRLVRNKMYNAALSGQTVADGTQGPTTTLRVARINGFTRARRPDLAAGSAVLFDFVSSSNPLRITINAVANTVIGYTPDNPGDEVGPGTLTLGTSVSVTDRDPVLSLDKTFLVRVGGGLKVDSITSSNILRLQDVQSAVARFRQQNVPEMPDGRYHCHLDPSSEAQLFRDPEWQSLNRSLPDYYMYKSMAVGEVLGTVFARNSEAPIVETVDSNAATYTTPASSYSLDDNFAGEVLNPSGVKIHRPIFVAQGGIYEYYQDLSALITDAGITGKVGEPRITNNGIEVMSERIQLIIRAPLNRLQDSVSASWKFIGDWPVRTDVATGDAARYKRFLVIEHGE
jgi:hypothetical protein